LHRRIPLAVLKQKRPAGRSNLMMLHRRIPLAVLKLCFGEGQGSKTAVAQVNTACGIETP
ncbi:hypothetical protein, partial [Selenomonas artemidis]|uniref:hypothetical protein n=1 Tax=Selenomonas artemidis TaxID=671224 RepID=UPI001B7FC116